MSTAKRQPWLKWFPADWRAESRLKMVSRAARSLWLDMLGLMHEAEPYGFLIVGRVPLNTAALIARALGDAESEIAPLIAQLESAGVFSRAGDVDLPDDVAALVPASIAAETILSRKMLRDQAKRDADRKNGGKGGNPTLKAEDNPPVNPRDNPPVNPRDNPPVKGGVKAQRPEARDQKESIPFLRNGAAGDGKSGNGKQHPSEPIPRDDKDWLWTVGLTWLSKATGRAEPGLRSQMGRWLKTAKDDPTALRSAIEAAQDQGVVEPIAWITAALAHRAKAAEPFEQTDEYGWRKRFESYRQNGGVGWPERWGGKSPGDHPAHPAALVAEFNFGSAG